MNSKTKIILTWGGITAMVCALHKVLLTVQGLSFSGWAYLNFLIFFLGLFIGIKQVKEKVNGGYLKFSQGYVTSILITLMVSVVGVISVAITLKCIPDLGARLLDQLHNGMIASGFSKEFTDKMMVIEAKEYTPGMILVNSFFGNIFVGAILGLIAAGSNVRKKPYIDEDVQELPKDEEGKG